MTNNLHGQEKIARSIATNWAAQIVQVLSGFVVPRLVDNNLGTEALGTWDLAWSIVTYFSLITIGSTSSINRFVAFHRSRGDTDTINQGVSSIAMIMRGMSGIVVIATLIVSYSVGPLFAERLQDHTDTLQWLVLILGIDIAIQVSSSVYASILTGCHRWEIHNGIQAATNVVMFMGMVGALMLGGGVVSLACVHLVSEAMGRTTRIIAARRTCPWLAIKVRHFRRPLAREMMKFGGKTFLADLSQLVLGASVNMLIATNLGPAALAIYARPFSLNRNFGVFVNKYAMVFSPMISSLRGAGKTAEAVDLTLSAARFGNHLILPVTLILLTHGNEIMELWMGSSYAEAGVVAIISLGFCFQLSNVSLMKSLIGFNLHGLPGAVQLGSAILAVISSHVALAYFDAGIKTVALIVAATMSVTHLAFMPAYASKSLKVGYGRYWRLTWLDALVANLPFAALTIASRIASDHGHRSASLILLAVAPLPLAWAYWRNLATSGLRKRLSRWSAKARGIEMIDGSTLDDPP